MKNSEELKSANYEKVSKREMRTSNFRFKKVYVT